MCISMAVLVKKIGWIRGGGGGGGLVGSEFLVH